MTDEVRQEDRGTVAITDEDRAASDECCDYWLTRTATCNVDVEEMFARHASPLRDRIAVLEGALELAAQRFEWLALGGVCTTNGACPNAGAKEARDVLMKEKG